ncbi:hypothetical protein [Desertivibrio insolitus]|uniref:hypothetical protein n=1 Tax=Herbiconiux sp. SYSU D00978 TaxID=2812562 RepID=UPI001A96EF1B|nr:hypothetical protein [Herbiconiux sp. SYSU D00978]
MTFPRLVAWGADVEGSDHRLDAEPILPGAWRVVDRACDHDDPSGILAFAEREGNEIALTHLGAVPVTCHLHDVAECVEHLERGTPCRKVA